MRYLLHDVFNESFLKYPNKIAVVEEDKTSFTYGDLNRLSVQFEQRGLYENPEEPLTEFIGQPMHTNKERNIVPDQNVSVTSAEDLLKLNIVYKEHFSRNKIFSFLSDPENQKDKTRSSFLSLFQVWSSTFQKMVLARTVLCSSESYQRVANIHMQEEFNHDVLLQEKTGSKIAPWDPILQSTAQWFIYQMYLLNEDEKVVLVHLVVEASASIFYANIPSFITDHTSFSQHFAVHQEADVYHENLGLDLLNVSNFRHGARLAQIQKEGWLMLNCIFERICELLDV